MSTETALSWAGISAKASVIEGLAKAGDTMNASDIALSLAKDIKKLSPLPRPRE
jgi:hypothetical protein